MIKTKNVVIGYEDGDFEEHEVVFSTVKGRRGTQIVTDFCALYDLCESQVWIKKG